MSHIPGSLMNRLSQTESAVFKLWMLYFQRVPFSDYLDIAIAVAVQCVGRETSLHTSIKCCYFYIFWSFGTMGLTLNWKQGIAQPRARRHEGCRIFQYLS